ATHATVLDGLDGSTSPPTTPGRSGWRAAPSPASKGPWTSDAGRTPMTARPLSDAFHPATTYLDTATYGLAADPVLEAMQRALQRWQAGTATMREYDDAVAQSRHLLAEILHTDPSLVAAANQASVLVGLVAAALPAGAT